MPGEVIGTDVVMGADGIWQDAHDESVAPQVGAEVRKVTGLKAVVLTVEPGILANGVPEGFAKIKRWTDERRER